METFLRRLPVAHRGLHTEDLPENSLPAFCEAARCGYAIETDVRFTKDRQLTVFHDDTLLRMTGDERTVFDCTMSEVRVLKLKNSEEKIPTMPELLATVQGRVPLLIEIKNMDGVKAEEIAAALSNSLEGYAGEYAVQSFNPFYVKAYKKLHPEIMCGVLASHSMSVPSDSLAWKFKAHLLERLRLNFLVKPDFVSYDGNGLPNRVVKRFKGIKLAWTIRSPEEETRVRQYVDNIIFEGFCPKK